MNSSATRSSRDRGVVVHNAPAHRRGSRIEREIEPAGELHPAQHAQRIFGEGLAGGAQHAILQILGAAEEIEKFVRHRIVGHRVDGEVAAAGGFARRNAGIEGGLKVAMPEPELAVAAGNAEVVLVAARIQLDHAEALAHQIDAAVPGENSGQLVVGHSVDLDIEILGLAAQ